MENKAKKTKIFKFGVVWQCYGTQAVEVPEDFTQEQSEQYVQEHWWEIDLPDGEYVDNSDEPDFEDSSFISSETKEV